MLGEVKCSEKVPDLSEPTSSDAKKDHCPRRAIWRSQVHVPSHTQFGLGTLVEPTSKELGRKQPNYAGTTQGTTL